MVVNNFKSCKELGTSFVTLVDSNARGYCQVRGIFDTYTKKASMNEQTRERWKGKVKVTKSYIAQVSTGITDKNMFLTSSSTNRIR